MENRPVDLTDEEELSSGPAIPERTVYVVSALLAVAGIIIGAVIPELTGQEAAEEENGYSEVLSTISVSTIDHLETSGEIFTHVSIPEAYFITVSEGSNISGIDTITNDYLSFILEEKNGYRLVISDGQGWESEFERTVSEGNTEGTPDRTESLEVLVDLTDEGNEVTIRFLLEIWEVR